MSYVRINNTLINLDYLVRADLYPEERPGRSTALITLAHAKPIKLDDEAAEAFIEFWKSRGDYSGDMGVMSLATFKRPAVVEAEKLKFTETPLNVGQSKKTPTDEYVSRMSVGRGFFNDAQCPVKIYHDELTVPCPACGLKPGNA